MEPGQGFFYPIGSNQPVIERVDVNDYISWKDGIFKFDEKPLIEIVQRVIKYYNIPIQIESEELANTVVSGKLDISGDFELAMQNLAKTIEGRYEKIYAGGWANIHRQCVGLLILIKKKITICWELKNVTVKLLVKKY